MYVEPPAEHTPAFANAVWKLRKVVYDLEEAMVDFDNLFEDVACGRARRPGDEGLRMTRLLSEPSA